MTSPVRLLIFDCDGVLVDSELLSASVLTGMLSAIGLTITKEIFHSDFLGRSFAAAARNTEIRFQRELPSDFQLRYRKELLARMRGHLQPMPGVKDMLDSLTLPFCMATSSSPERLAVTMEETGLARWFSSSRCFTASMVPRGKPDPDLFLHAAAAMGVSPQECLVIEDSEMGIRAARAAGMGVWHFIGGSHHRAGVRVENATAPDAVIADMQGLAAAIHAL